QPELVVGQGREGEAEKQGLGPAGEPFEGASVLRLVALAGLLPAVGDLGGEVFAIEGHGRRWGWGGYVASEIAKRAHGLVVGRKNGVKAVGIDPRLHNGCTDSI